MLFVDTRRRFSLALRAARQLGLSQAAWYAWYRLLLRSGWLNRCPQPAPLPQAASAWRPRLPLPERARLRRLLGADGARSACAAAEEIVRGQARLFGGPPRPLLLVPPPPLEHWTRYDTAAALRKLGLPDVKYLWEPARFGWVFPLGRAYRLTGEPRYAAAFWGYAETFWEANPPCRGPNWESAQEVALRLMALAWGGAVFADAPASTPPRLTRLRQSLAEHAARIPPTLAYARAQNNNHLLSEAAGLLTAAALLPEHPQARRWRRLGMRWWRWGLRHQVAPDGEYVQHSANYHRLMLQLALWVQMLVPEASAGPPQEALARGARWLLRLCDPESGGVPNLGPNDGAYLFPLSGQPFADYRPVLQAAARAFLGERPFPPGAWDEMPLWFPAPRREPRRPSERAQTGILRAPEGGAWACLRAVRLTSRPGHADQLHLDLWSGGRNLLLDAGTYLYNAPPPWDNALAQAAVHNTVTVDGRDQMTRAGRFLYLDWAQGALTGRERAADGSWARLRARHDGYRRLGIGHERAVTAHAGGLWVVEDLLSGQSAAVRAFRLHWLMPDGQWSVDEDGEGWTVTLRLPQAGIRLRLTVRTFPPAASAGLTLARAGNLLYGEGAVPPWRGWFSPTYGVKTPALSLAVNLRAAPPARFVTRIRIEAAPDASAVSPSPS